MKKKINENYVYYGIAIMVVALFLVIAFNNLIGKKREADIDIESKLTKRQMQEQKKEYKDPVIRVLIKTNGFKEITHPEVQLQSKNGLILTAGEEKIESAAEEIVTITPEAALFQNGTIHVQAKEPADKIMVVNLNRGYGSPLYRGSFELIATAEGIVLVNQLHMEEYLYAVVPSEMPASYEIEALKAQAVCARSYAYNQSQAMSYPEYNAHMDDSTSFQVYGNSKEQDKTVQAVDETRGQKIWYNNQVVTAYYYSTSCGKSTGIEAWGTAPNEKNEYLKSVNICKEDGNAYEETLPWFRWKATVPEETLTNLIELNTKTHIGILRKVTVTKRGGGGVVLQLVAEGSQGSVTIDTENEIRKALGGRGYQIEKQDGTIVDSSVLLPSAFFTIEKIDHSYWINGGGFGHGIGMSQNGANEMAKAGKTYLEILQFFYQGVAVK